MTDEEAEGEVNVTFEELGKSKPRRAKAAVSKIVTGTGVGLSVMALVVTGFVSPVFAGGGDYTTVPVEAPKSSAINEITREIDLSISRNVNRAPIPSIPKKPVVVVKDPLYTPSTIPTLEPAKVPAGAALIGAKNAKAAAVPVAEVIKPSDNIENGRLAWPLGTKYTTSSYGPRFHPIRKTQSFHTGMDMSAACGVPIMASSDGVVTAAGWNNAYGNRIVIEHTASISTTYSHMSSMISKVGDKVKEGQVIGLVGTTGWSTGCHLHFEVAKDGSYVNPWSWLTGEADPVTDTVAYSTLHAGGTQSPYNQGNGGNAGDVELSEATPFVPKVPETSAVAPNNSAAPVAPSEAPESQTPSTTPQVPTKPSESVPEPPKQTTEPVAPTPTPDVTTPAPPPPPPPVVTPLPPPPVVTPTPVVTPPPPPPVDPVKPVPPVVEKPLPPVETPPTSEPSNTVTE